MKLENLKLNPTIQIEMENDEMVKLWHELEHLSDAEIINRDSVLFGLKLLIKENVFKLDKIN